MPTRRRGREDRWIWEPRHRRPKPLELVTNAEKNGANSVGDQERRDAPRVGYGLTLYVAPFDGENFPRRDQFVEVEGRDISTTGISFLSDEPATPGDKLVIVARNDAVVCVTARIIHCQEVPAATSCAYVVGCVLERRIARHNSPGPGFGSER